MKKSTLKTYEEAIIIINKRAELFNKWAEFLDKQAELIHKQVELLEEYDQLVGQLREENVKLTK